MDELSSEARALLKRVAPADGPTDADRARVLGLISGSLATPAAAASGVASAGAAGTVAAGGTLKLVLAFAISVGVGGVATTALTPRPAPPAPGPSAGVARPAPAAPEARPIDLALPEPSPEPKPPAPAPATEKRAVARAEPPKPSAPEQTPPVAVAAVPRLVARDETCELPAELAAVQQAQQVLTAAPAQAVLVLDAFAARCPAGTLVEERLATRALALCLAGRHADGRAAAQGLADRFPTSPSLARVTQSCAQ